LCLPRCLVFSLKWENNLSLCITEMHTTFIYFIIFEGNKYLLQRHHILKINSNTKKTLLERSPIISDSDSMRKSPTALAVYIPCYHFWSVALRIHVLPILH
jgi:hypothetical protein